MYGDSNSLRTGTAPLWVGFEETGDGVQSAHFYDRLLARLDERDFKLRA